MEFLTATEARKQTEEVANSKYEEQRRMVLSAIKTSISNGGDMSTTSFSHAMAPSLEVELKIKGYRIHRNARYEWGYDIIWGHE